MSVQLTLDSDIFQDLLEEAESSKRTLNAVVEDTVLFWSRTKKSRSFPEMQTMIQHLEVLEEIIRALTEPASIRTDSEER